jgi:hypothetical protein
MYERLGGALFRALTKFKGAHGVSEYAFGKIFPTADRSPVRMNAWERFVMAAAGPMVVLLFSGFVIAALGFAAGPALALAGVGLMSPFWMLGFGNLLSFRNPGDRGYEIIGAIRQAMGQPMLVPVASMRSGIGQATAPVVAEILGGAGRDLRGFAERTLRSENASSHSFGRLGVLADTANELIEQTKTPEDREMVLKYLGSVRMLANSDGSIDENEARNLQILSLAAMTILESIGNGIEGAKNWRVTVDIDKMPKSDKDNNGPGRKFFRRQTIICQRGQQRNPWFLFPRRRGQGDQIRRIPEGSPQLHVPRVDSQSG